MNRPFLCLLLALPMLVAPLPTRAAGEAGAQVSCQLPPQIRRLNRDSTYLAPGRVVRTSADDCRQRGGRALASEPASSAPLAQREGAPVMVGGHADAPACAVRGEIAGLRTGSSLSVRMGPARQHERVDGLQNGQRVYVCDGSADDEWLGVVYARGAEQDCGVDAARAEAVAYDGPCASGWVSAGWVRQSD